MTGKQISIVVDGERVDTHHGSSIAATLISNGCRAWRRDVSGAPRGVYCGIGTCFDCTLTVDGSDNVRACITACADGMQITTQIRTP